MANINDVANAAGVSKSTVSNVFNGRSNVSDQVKKRVLGVAKDLGYYPNRLASALTTKRTKLVGLFIDNNDSFRHMDKKLIEGVARKLNESDQHLTLYLTPLTKGDAGDNLNRKLITEPIDGAIIIGPMLEDVRISELIELDKKLVVVGHAPTAKGKLNSVDVDNVAIAYGVAMTLYELGHKKVALINSEANMTITTDRLKGYLKAQKEADQEYDPELTVYCDGSEQQAYELSGRLLEDDEITAVITCSDQVAAGLYRKASELGRHIPDDLSVFALGGRDKSLKPTLSTVHVDYSYLGQAAVDLLASDEVGAERMLDAYEMMISASISKNTKVGFTNQ